MESGIYCIENLLNGKKYIGKSEKLKQRISKHKYFWRKDFCAERYNKYLWNSVKKYGQENFSIKILEFCDKEFLNDREKYYIDAFASHISENGYNYSYGGEGQSGFSFSEESKTKRSKKMMENNPMKNRNNLGENSPAFGRKHHSSTSKYYGVSTKLSKGKYLYYASQVQYKNKFYRLGQYKSEVDAAKSYDNFIVENNLPHPLNFPEAQK